ncbi:MAG TPA: Gmad2 immunoglobulin-like domain-containing protein [Flavisolibacter sp.]|jgi:hypothetical protein|nr:Gmad2 immunoglobulin-like domain-containing protein [Flavisolibacter sp.]
MRVVTAITLLLLVACGNPDSGTANTVTDDTTSRKTADSPVSPRPIADTTANLPRRKIYSNERFRNVNVEKVDDSTFRVSGQGQIFEARFGWIVEDGHYELASGFESTAAGAPAWGDFSFLVTAAKKRSNSIRHLVLFETSAKDGSRQHRLPIPLD